MNQDVEKKEFKSRLQLAIEQVEEMKKVSSDYHQILMLRILEQLIKEQVPDENRDTSAR